MEIVLQGYGIYNIPNWKGQVEVGELNFFQAKRIADSKDQLSLFRKFIKIMKSQDSPVKLPEGLAPEDLDLWDFTQLLLGITFTSKGKSQQRTLTCPKCKKPQPRVIDLLKVFVPRAPKKAGGIDSVKVLVGKKEIQVACRNIRVKDFIEVKQKAEELSILIDKGPAGILNFERVQEVYPFYKFNDIEDLDDFYEILEDFGLVIQCIDLADMDFNKRLEWAGALKGTQSGIYAKIANAVYALSPGLDVDYKTTCTICKHEIQAELSPLDFFFG